MSAPAKADTTAAKEAKEPSAKAGDKPKKQRVKPTHPPYLTMISEAISELKDRSGSSRQAIAKKVEELYGKDISDATWRKKLSHFLGIFTEQGKFVKVKGSFKMSDDLKKALKDEKTTKEKVALKLKATQEKGEAKPKKPAAKPTKVSSPPQKETLKGVEPKTDAGKPVKAKAPPMLKSGQRKGKAAKSQEAKAEKRKMLSKKEPKKVMPAKTAPGKRATPRKAVSPPKKSKK
ncbi:hypothetical protein Vafri_20829 [Volvox africanus]|uniref:H15 domain-containing protein n=1 Tax=Volvox africanus TaxID=51714 RepID=A0A8J4FEC2_9CHLO|nr:hypothetical protein Vafri_20829 [Volvox africanus]